MSLSAVIKKKVPGFSLDVSIEEENEVMALLGSSGCGKSMTLMCIAGLMKPDEGRIVLNGRTLFDSEKKINVPPQKRRIGYLFQQYALFPNMTVLQNVMAGVREGSRAQRRERALREIHIFHMEDCMNQYPRELSGGQQQRCALARIFASDPELLLLDEPFSALDDALKWQLEMEMSDVIRKGAMETIFVSHSQEECLRLCDSVSGIDNGRNEKKVSAAEMYSHPRTRTAAMLSGYRNVAGARADDSAHALFVPEWDAVLKSAYEVPAETAFAGIRDASVYIAHRAERFSSHVQDVIDNKAEDLNSPVRYGFITRTFSKDSAKGDESPVNALHAVVDRISVNTVTAVGIVRVGNGVFYLEKPRAEMAGLRSGDAVEIRIRPEDVLPLV